MLGKDWDVGLTRPAPLCSRSTLKALMLGWYMGPTGRPTPLCGLSTSASMLGWNIRLTGWPAPLCSLSTSALMLDWDVSALLEAWTVGSTGPPAFCDLATDTLESWDLEDCEEIEDWPSLLSLEGEDRKALNFLILLAFDLSSRRWI